MQYNQVLKKENNIFFMIFMIINRFINMDFYEKNIDTIS